jgi:hypothetical protein
MVNIGIALDLDTHKYKVTRNEAGSRATFINMVAVGLTMIHDNEGDGLVSEVDVFCCLFGVFEDRRAWNR